jgi:hypothetical protein
MFMQVHNLNIYTMKNLILGAIMLTGAVAFAQEPAKQTQQTQSSTTTTTTTPANQSQPAQQPQKADAKAAQPATTERRTEAVREERNVTTEKKADPAKKS